MTLRQYISNILHVVDQAANVVIGGSPDETISARAGRERYKWPHTWGLLARVLDWIQPFHTSRAIDDDEVRAEALAEREREAGQAQADEVDERIRGKL